MSNMYLPMKALPASRTLQPQSSSEMISPCFGARSSMRLWKGTSDSRLARSPASSAVTVLAALALLIPMSLALLTATTQIAGATTISSDKAQVSQIEQQIALYSAQIDHLSFMYDQAQSQEATLQAQIASTQQSLAKTKETEDAAHSRLEQAAIDAYVNEGTGSSAMGLLLSSKANQYTIGVEYLNVATGHLEEDLVAYRREQDAYTAQQAKLDGEQAAVRATMATLASDQASAQAEVNRENTLLSQVKGNLQQLLQAAHEQEVRQAEAAAAERAAAAAAAAAARAAPTLLLPSSPTLPPPANWRQQAQIAVQTALAQVGKPYQWGGAGPNSFDCSGLVMYAWEAAGVDLPHYSVSQYDDTTHVPESDLQPGDIVFYNSPYDGNLGHEALYIGNGQVVQAPMTGMDVQVTSITWAGPPVAFGQPA